MSSDMNEAIDLSKPIEAVHEDGRIQPVSVDGSPDRSGDFSTEDVDGVNGIWLYNGKPWSVYMDHRKHLRGWRIRNVAQPTSAPEVPAALVERMVALVKGAAAERAKFDNPGAWFSFSSELGDEARAIVAELMPVDGDLDEARKIADDFNPESDDVYYAALAAIRRGRELERGEG